MENLKKNPIAWAIITAVGYLILICAIFFVLSLIRSDKTFVETITEPFMLVILGIGTVVSGVEGYMKAKKRLGGEKKE